MHSTELLYLRYFNQIICAAHVESVTEENGQVVVVLDQTVFYPQGGGQPYDQGTITKDGTIFQVSEVRFADGPVRHIGQFQNGTFAPGDSVNCTVDPDRRSLHSKLHSAGHVVDMAVTALKLPWVPGKGYHFPNGPYVEYEGNAAPEDRERLKQDIEQKCNDLIARGAEAKLLFIDKDKMHEVCAHVPDYIPEGKPARVVMFGDFGVPCGGTHVKNISEIKHMTIRKVKPSGKNIQVGYDIDR
jgi:Ser-tRNA(Ala) deacylase AlaX